MRFRKQDREEAESIYDLKKEAGVTKMRDFGTQGGPGALFPHTRVITPRMEDSKTLVTLERASFLEGDYSN